MAEPAPRYCYRHPDRETGLSCSECGRPICYECMTPAAVGIRCPEHSGQAQGVRRVRQTARQASYDSAGAYVTKILIAINVGIYLLELALGGDINGTGNTIYEHGALVISAVYADGSLAGLAHGDWWRLLSAAFLHYGPIHLGMNMLALWWFGQPLEYAIGRGRFLLLYLVSGLAGSAGALLLSPNAITVGASGAIFGILGAALVLERQGSMVFGGQALTLIVINLVFTFAIGNISIGGHIGGLIGGAVCMLAFTRFGRGHAIYGRPGLLGIVSVVAVGVISVAISYWKVRGYA
jgi:membrane associated rhomboid family serine protease